MDNTRSYNFKKIHRKNKKNNIFLIILLILSIILSSIYISYNLFNIKSIVNYGFVIINSLFIVFANIGLFITYKRSKDVFTFSSVIMNLFLMFILLSTFNLIKLPTLKTVKDFEGKNITEALKWADANDIDVVQLYDDSDTVKEYHIINQSIDEGTTLNKVDSIEFTVSRGPNYNKEFILESLTGKNIDEVIKYIDDNKLNNVVVKFEVNEEYDRDIVFKQSVTGEVKRNDEIVFTVSYGENTDFGDIKMIDLKGLSKFKAELFLNRNALNYVSDYDFSDNYDKDYIINQNIKKDELVNKDDKISITISKGNKIKVPDIKNMTQGEVTNWVIENKLKIIFKERYDLDVKIGSIIDSDFKKDDTIEEGQTITVIISKGQLKFKEFSTLNDFKVWADNNDVKYTEEYEKSKTIKKGDIINYSVNDGDIINPFENVIVTVSTGDTTIIPNFIGKSKYEINKLCTSNKLNCSFYYVGYTSKNKDIATRQSKYAGSEVIEGTSISVGLSSGITSNKPNIDTSKPTTPPANNCKKKTIYLTNGNSIEETKNMIRLQNPDFKFTFTTGNPGYGNNGSLYGEMFALYQGKVHDTCKTINIKLVQR